MKKVLLFYADTLEQYIVNERAEKLADVPSENIKDSIEEAENFVKQKYPKKE